MNILILTILFPLLSFITLAISQGQWSKIVSSVIGIIGIGIANIIAIYLVFYFHVYVYDHLNFVLVQDLCTWFKIDNFHITLSLRLDSLSLIMLLIITGVGFIIHIYSIWYMYENEGYVRFFVYTNLFMSNMLLLVLSDNLLLVYFGWEMVGLCSYLLIGFYYFDFSNGLNALKAFIITRFGDICIICALFIIYDQYSTLSLSKLLQLDLQSLSNPRSIWISAFLLAGAVGKSAQFPLQAWLISAMVGPTPVSALIHSATMVTAGVYLIHRMHNFFLLTPCILHIMGIIGAITLIVAACSALYQSNIKKILAYSTVSQIGYMFLALGERNWNGAIYHVVTHAFFKALLFLSAGSLIYACKNEQNIFRMGGLYKSIPFIYMCFLIGGLSLSGLPIVTAGFYSKELILLSIFNNRDYFLLFLGLIGILLTSTYIFRLIFIVFHGRQILIPEIKNGFCQYFALIIFSLLSTVIGIRIPLFLLNDIDDSIYNIDYCYKQYFVIVSAILVCVGALIAYIFWYDSKVNFKYIRKINKFIDLGIRYFILLCHYGWGLDFLYKKIFIKPYLFIAKKLFYYNDFFISKINKYVLFFYYWIGYCLIYISKEQVHWCIVSITVGAILILLTVFIKFYIFYI